MLRKVLRLVFALWMSAACLTSFPFGGSGAAAADRGVAASPFDIRPLLVGTKVPPMILNGIDGKPFDLTKAILKKPTVLVFYRGGW